MVGVCGFLISGSEFLLSSFYKRAITLDMTHVLGQALSILNVNVSGHKIFAYGGVHLVSGLCMGSI